MAVDYATLKKGGFMRQKQKNNFSLRLAVVGGNLTAENLKIIAEVADKYGIPVFQPEKIKNDYERILEVTSDFQTECGNSIH